MKVSAISFQGDLTKGRKKFEKLPLIEQIALKSKENARQKFNQTHFPPIPEQKGDLADYVRHIVMMENIVKNKANEIFKNVRNALKI